jgi:hypothetical protein
MGIRSEYRLETIATASLRRPRPFRREAGGLLMDIARLEGVDYLLGITD